MGLAGGLATNGGLVVSGSSFPAGSIPNASLVTPPNLRDIYIVPTGALAESVPRWSVNIATGGTSTGQLRCTAIVLPKGLSVNSITFVAGSTGLAASAASNQWFALFDLNRNKLAVTTDDTTAAWTASSGGTAGTKTLAIATPSPPFVTTYEGIYYLGLVVVGSSALTQSCFNGYAPAAGIAPILAGTSTTGLTNPASCPTTAAALGVVQTIPYAYVS